jgi:hypothetical protein
MKNLKILMSIATMLFVVSATYGQKGEITLNTNEIPEVTHVKLEEFPTDEVLPMIHDWGGMTVDLNNAPKGSDFRPLLMGLENDHCQVPHWGYVVKGAILIEYEDGTSETFKEGEAFYMKPGHTGEVLEDLMLVSFSPDEGMHELAKHLEKKFAEMQKKQE